MKKSEAVTKVADELTKQLNDFIDKGDYSEDTYKVFEDRFKDTLNDESNNQLLQNHRIFKKVVVANILIALTMVGALFVAGKLAYSYATTGKAAGFFSRTRSEQHLKDVADKAEILERSDTPQCKT